MAQALFITRNDLVKYTAINGNVDTDKFLQFIKIAQDIHIQNYLGTDLFNKISNDIIADSLSGDYLTLVNTYIKPMVIHWAMVEYLPFASYTIANKGIYKHSAENSTVVEANEVDFLLKKSRNLAQYYTDRFINYMSFQASSIFPEYYTNNNEDIYPDKDANFEGWVL
jgi:hypothetical protein